MFIGQVVLWLGLWFIDLSLCLEMEFKNLVGEFLCRINVRQFYRWELVSIWFTYWFMCCVCDSCIVVDYNHSGSKYNDNTPCRDFPFPVVVSWRFYAWMLELMQGFSLKELSISVLQSFNSLCLLQGFSECCPVRNIFARTWGPCEAAIPVSILNRSQTGIKCRKLYHIVRFCSMLEFI